MSQHVVSEQAPILKDALELRATDLQIEAMAQNSQQWALSRALTTLQVLAWFLAIASCAMPIAIYKWETMEMVPYAVTTSGYVSVLEPIDQKVIEALLEKK